MPPRRKPATTAELPAPLRRYALKKVKSGEYRSARDVVTDALKVLKERDEWLADTRAKLLEGERAIREGRVMPIDGLLERVRARALRKPSGERRRKSA
jgi:putative addiction module CopG family antidote